MFDSKHHMVKTTEFFFVFISVVQWDFYRKNIDDIDFVFHLFLSLIIRSLVFRLISTKTYANQKQNSVLYFYVEA